MGFMNLSKSFDEKINLLDLPPRISSSLLLAPPPHPSPPRYPYASVIGRRSFFVLCERDLSADL